MSIQADDVQKLADLANIQIDESEIPGFVKDFEGILAYVDQLREVVIPDGLEPMLLETNVLREDENPVEAGIYTEDILGQAPDRKGDYFKVPKIL